MTDRPAIPDFVFRDLVWAAKRGGAASRPQSPDVLARLRELSEPATVQECLRELFPDLDAFELAEAFASGIAGGDIIEILERDDGALRYVAERRHRRRLDPRILALLRPEEPRRRTR